MGETFEKHNVHWWRQVVAVREDRLERLRLLNAPKAILDENRRMLAEAERKVVQARLEGWA